MGFHLEEEFVFDGSIDNRIKGRTLLRLNFTNHTSSLVTLRGNPCRDLAGSLWTFRNPHARMDEQPGEQCAFFIPPLSEGAAGRISYSKKREISILPPAEHYSRLFDDEQEDPPTEIAPILELEWFSDEFHQIEIHCERMVLELVEIAWSLPAEEAAAEQTKVDHYRETVTSGFDDWAAGIGDDDDLEVDDEDDFYDEDPEPHELEELCFLIVEEFKINS
jgi:hypothetical protein